MLSKMYSRMFGNSSAIGASYLEAETLSESGLRGFSERTLLLINSTSFDAPLVGVVWLWCFSSIYSVDIYFHHYLILFSVTWLSYSGDRLLDSLRMPAVYCKLPRHQFATTHFKPLICIWALIATFSVLFLFHALSLTEIVWGFCLLGLLLIYFLGCFCFPRQMRAIVPREFLVGLFFSSASHFFVLLQVGHWSLYSAWTFICFLSLCSLNCLSISRWEYSADEQVGEVSFFTRNPRQIHHFQSILLWFVWLQVIVCCFVVLMGRTLVFEFSVLLSAFFLLVLDRRSLSTHIKPVLADFSMLTPCIFLSFS
ncbi:hypothetical protein V202x_01360 [Gimesia aquarii]|uniref:Prenyltransferase n=1 Tax=Gimesia aquarii TaxID=2527964 RepID=A0A517WNI6_9PLAN|nr:hypothetical protein V202x_01360 [Gimesia aquarii]